MYSTCVTGSGGGGSKREMKFTESKSSFPSKPGSKGSNEPKNHVAATKKKKEAEEGSSNGRGSFTGGSSRGHLNGNSNLNG